ncbi:expressed unknown protein [Seminavis robusta]|uniref:Uncharacterized protein n=1 Tax=Seminavis robusta TaxID=568900 RepID=A0A9N8H9Y1_9STRA|nr:expressed unknown protein [Seminavis robusta]|eukprot:Sro130_g062010.1 n/a (632) ;mRNA; f:87602-89577
MPQRPKRQESSAKKMLGTKGRSRISFGRKGRKKKSRGYEEDEMNIFCSSGLVSRDFILEKLQEVKNNRDIVKLEVEDLIIAKEHSSLIQFVKALLVGENRPWKRIDFIDSFPSCEFSWWEGIKKELMREYDMSIDDASKYTNCITIQANVELNEGSAKNSVVALFNRFLEDKDIQGIDFGGALFGIRNASIPEALNRLFDEDCVLKDSTVVTVKCGWPSTEEERSDQMWEDTIRSCVMKLDGTAIVKEGYTHLVPSGPRRMQRRQAVQCGVRPTKSLDESAARALVSSLILGCESMPKGKANDPSLSNFCANGFSSRSMHEGFHKCAVGQGTTAKGMRLSNSGGLIGSRAQRSQSNSLPGEHITEPDDEAIPTSNARWGSGSQSSRSRSPIRISPKPTRVRRTRSMGLGQALDSNINISPKDPDLRLEASTPRRSGRKVSAIPRPSAKTKLQRAKSMGHYLSDMKDVKRDDKDQISQAAGLSPKRFVRSSSTPSPIRTRRLQSAEDRNRDRVNAQWTDTTHPACIRMRRYKNMGLGDEASDEAYDEESVKQPEHRREQRPSSETIRRTKSNGSNSRYHEKAKRSASEKLHGTRSDGYQCHSDIPDYDWSNKDVRYDWSKGIYTRMEVPSAA